MAENRTKSAREGKPFSVIYGNLKHALEFVLHRVFNRDNLGQPVVYLRQGSIQGSSLAAAGGAGNQ